MAKRNADMHKHWNEQAVALLKGRTIVDVKYMGDEDKNTLMWDRAAVVLILDNGTTIFPSADDEGNGPGALFTSSETTPILPVI